MSSLVASEPRHVDLGANGCARATRELVRFEPGRGVEVSGWPLDDFLVRSVRKMFGGSIGTDPCSGPDNPTLADLWYREHDGLREAWCGPVFVNRAVAPLRMGWVKRCMFHDAPVVLVAPARSDNLTFQLALGACHSVVLLQEPLKFARVDVDGHHCATARPHAIFGFRIDLYPLHRLGTVLRAHAGRPDVLAGIDMPEPPDDATARVRHALKLHQRRRLRQGRAADNGTGSGAAEHPTP